MQEVDINILVNKYNRLNKIIPNDIIITGKINRLHIYHIHDKLDLSRVECNVIDYYNQEGESIKNHKLPNLLKKLDCSMNNLTSLPDLPNSLEILFCWENKLTFLPDLPNSIKSLSCSNNQLTSLTDVQLPNSLIRLNIGFNKLKILPNLLHINHKIKIYFNQELPLSYIPYNPYLKLNKLYDHNINIEGYPHNPITNQQELDKYMEYIKNYQLNRIKSARK